MNTIREMHFKVAASPVNLRAPLIYMWEIKDRSGSIVFRYIGKSERGAVRPLRDYPRNVRNLLNGKSYRSGNPRGFRRVHWQLAHAFYLGHRITLKFLCNIPKGVSSFALERYFQKKYDC
jgi:hypothetical protein